MKRKYRIILISIAIACLLLFGLWLLRNLIVRYSLETVVYNKTSGKIALDIEGIDLKLFTGNVKLIHPNFSFTDVYLDETASSKLTNVEFDSISIFNLSIKRLLFNRKFHANALLLRKPVIRFSERLGPEKTSLKPEHLINALSKQAGGTPKIDVKIDSVNIDYGSIRINGDSANIKNPILADFSIRLHKFNTHPDSQLNDLRLFYSDDIVLQVENLKKLLISGYELDAGKIIFSSAKEVLKIYRPEIIPIMQLKNSQTSIELKSRMIEINGIDWKELSSMEIIHINSVNFDEGYMNLYLHPTREADTSDEKKKLIEGIQEKISSFKLDTLHIAGFTFNQFDTYHDTIGQFDNMDFKLTGIGIDSSMFDDLYNEFIYEYASLETGEIKYRLTKEGLIFNTSNIEFNSGDKKLVFPLIRLINDPFSNHEHTFDVLLNKLEVDGLNFKPIIKGQKLQLTFGLNNAFVDVDLEHPVFKSGNTKQAWKQMIDFSAIDLQNAEIHAFIGDKTDIDVVGLRFKLDSLTFDKNASYDFGSFSFGIENSKLKFNYGDLSFNTGNLVFDDQLFSVTDFKGIVKNKNIKGTVSSKYIGFEGFEIKDLVYDSILFSENLLIDGLSFNGEIDISPKNNKNRDNQSLLLPVKYLNLSNLTTINSELELNLKSKEQLNQINTDIEFEFKDLYIDDTFELKEWISQLNGNTNLSNFDTDFSNYSFTADDIQLDFTNRNFTLDGLLLNAKSYLDSITPSSSIRKLEVNSVSLSRIDLPMFLMNDSVRFGKLQIHEPTLDLSLQPANSDNESKKLDFEELFNKYLEIAYDTIEIADALLKAEQINDSSNSLLGFGKLNFGHYNLLNKSGNLLNEISFDFEDFFLADSIKHRFVSIESGKYNIRKSNLFVNEIRFRQPESGFEKADKKPVFSFFYSPGIEFSGIHLADQLPSILDINKLSIDTIQLGLSLKNRAYSKQEKPVDLSYLMRYTKIISRLGIDTTVLSNINIQYQVSDDSSLKSINIDSLGIVVNSVVLDSNVLSKKDPVALLESLSIDMRDRTLISRDSLYTFHADKVFLNFPERRITIDSLCILPRFIDTVFFKKAIYQTDRASFFSHKIVLNEFRLEEILENNHLHIGSIDVLNAEAELIRDLRYPMKPGTYRKMPQQLLSDINRIFTIDSARIINSKLRYGEYTAKSDFMGDINFEKLNLQAYHISNNFKAFKRETSLKVNFETSIEGEAKLTASVIFPLMSEQNEFWLTGKSEAMDLTKLNKLTQNVIGVAITRGKGSIDVPLISGNNIYSKGTVTFRYKKLKLAMYNRDQQVLQSGFKSRFMNFMINDLLLKSNNPKFARKVRIGQVYFKRNTEKAMTNYLWKSVLSGMMSTMGFNSKEQRQEKREYKKDAR